LSVQIAEKVVRTELSNATAQKQMMERLLDEIDVPKS